MTAPHIVDPAHVLGNLLTQASPGHDAHPAADPDQRPPLG